jgi:hypothetical protein
VAIGYPYYVLSSVSIFSFLFVFSEFHRHHFDKFSRQNIWGNCKIRLLDTLFWPIMREDPQRYNERFRAKVDLATYDFVVMPMFES